ncbi:MAG: hypothetical protein QOE58_2676, partial [Actinomycetota bacterium]|nr:hypothetical protein [Actinomycetota bacterium]
MTGSIGNADFLLRLEQELIGLGLATPTPAEPDDLSGPTELTASELRLWFVDRLQPDTAQYNVAAAATVHGPLDVERLTAAFRAVAGSCEPLRTVFPDEQGRPYVDLLPVAPSVQDVQVRFEPDHHAAQRWLIAQAQRSFDLSTGPLARFAVVSSAPEVHLLVLCVHHIVADGASVDVVLQDLLAVYGGLTTTRRVRQLPTAASRAQEQAQLGWWLEELAGAPTVLELPVDRARVETPGRYGARFEHVLDPGEARQVRDFARENRVTTQSVYQAVLRCLLSVLTGCNDVLVGIPVSVRQREDQFGNHVNLLAQRVPLTPETSLRQLVQRVQDHGAQGLQHRLAPFDRLVEALAPERLPGRHPLVQVVLNYQRPAASGAVLRDGVTFERLDLDLGTTKFDLTLTVDETPHGTRLYLEHDADSVTDGTARSWLNTYVALLVSGLGAPDLPVCALSLGVESPCGPAAVGRVPLPSPLSSFEEQVAAHPEREAAVHGADRLTYAQLDDLAEELAGRLVEQQLDPQVPVAVLVERGLVFLIAVVGLAKAGLTCLPLDEEHPPQRLSSLLDDASTTHVVGDPARLLDLDRPGLIAVPLLAPTGSVEPGAQGLVRTPAAREAPSPQLPLYRIYTSGSTGRPKGVTVTHGNVAALLAHAGPELELGPQDRWTLFHSVAFDFSVWEIWGPLTSGGAVIVVDRDVARAPDRLLALLVHERITVLCQTPTAFDSLLHLWAGTYAPLPLELRLVVFGGEALRPAALASWFDLPGALGIRLVNMYGITETTVHVTWRDVVSGDASSLTAGSPIGVALPHLSTYVLDPWTRPLPPGVPGELFVGGAGVASGYADRPGLSALRFLPDPFSTGGGRMYRTGDRVRLAADSSVVYLGRTDDQVKVRGYRVEPGEVEAVLTAHPQIVQAGVVAAEGRLIAFVQPVSPDCDPGLLREHCAEQLPVHMVPLLVLRDSLPRNVNGKLDRALLRAGVPDATMNAQAGAPHRDPSGPAETLLAEVWAQVLGREVVGAEDNFFELGGDSIRAVQVAALAQERGLTTSVADVFAAQTVAKLAQRTSRAPAPATSTPPFSLLSKRDRDLVPADCEDAYPLTVLQQGMVFHQLESAAYVNVSGVPVQATFDEAAFRRAVDHVIRRHPMLRTSFDLSTYDEPVQLVHPWVPTPVTIRDLRTGASTAVS